MKYSKLFNNVFVKIIIFSTTIFIFFISCNINFKPIAFGPRDVINVVTDSSVWNSYRSSLEEILWDTRYYPSFEHVFDLEFTPSENFWEKRTDFWRRHNILIISTDDTASSTYNIVKNHISDGFGIYVFKDLWASPQIVMMLIVEENKFDDFLKENSTEIFNTFFDDVSDRLFYILYKDGDQYQEIIYDLFKADYNFSIKFPHYYVISGRSGTEDSGYVIGVQHMRSGTHNAISRYISVIWKTDPDFLPSFDNITKWRDSFASTYFEGDKLILKDSISDSLGLKFEGLWQNPEQGAGGPWRGWIIIHNDIVYLVETHVFSPGNKKSFYLEELRLIAGTFQILE